MATVSYYARMKIIAETLTGSDFFAENNIEVILSDQLVQPIRDSNSPLLFFGIQRHQKMMFQEYNKVFDEETDKYIVSGRYCARNTLFFHFYGFDYSPVDVCQTVGLMLNYTDFSAYKMSASWFKLVDNRTYPSMLQGQVKQFYGLTIDFMMDDDVILSTAYPADGVTVTGTISGMNVNIGVFE